MEIKEKIIDRIRSIDDPVFLEEIYRLLSSSQDSPVYEMTPEELKSVEEGMAGAENGRVISQEEAAEFYKKWRDEKLNGL